MIDWESLEKKYSYKQPNKKPQAPRPIPQAKPLIDTPRGAIQQNDRRRYQDTVTEGLKQSIEDNSGTRFMYGILEGFAPLSTKQGVERRFGQDTVDTLDNSKAYQGGKIAGTVGQFALPYVGASGKIGSALSKLPQYSKMGKLGQGITKSIATDLAVGLPLNVNQAFNKEGLQGDEALKNIALNTGIDLIAGGILEAVPIILKSGKKVASKTDFDMLRPDEQNELLTKLAYESNVRKGKITPQNDTLYGNSFRPVMGELPLPKENATTFVEKFSTKEVPRTITRNELPRAQRNIPLNTMQKASNLTVEPRNVEKGTRQPQEQLFTKNDVLEKTGKAEKKTQYSFTPEFSERLERDYKTFMDETVDFEPSTQSTGVSEYAGQFTDKGVTRSKDIFRNIEAATKNSPEAKQQINETFVKPFEEAKGEYSRQVQTKLDTLHKGVVKDLGIRKGSKEDAGIMWYGEGGKQRRSGDTLSTEMEPYTLDDLKRDFDYKMPNGKKAWENIVQAEWKIRKEYVQYVDRINEALRKIYPNVEENVAKLQEKLSRTVGEEARKKVLQEIEDAQVGKRLFPRKDYFRHFQEMKQNNFLVGLDNIINGATNIDPRLIGVSEFTKPNSKWTGFLQRRKDGDVYTESALGGILEYIPQAEYKINIEPNIPVLRSIIKDLKENTVQTKNANGFIDILMQTANDLAGKTNQLDRSFVNLFANEVQGRQALNVLSSVSNRMRRNAVMGNLNSVIAQFFNMPNVVGYAKNPVDIAEGFKTSILASLGNKEAKGLLDKSNFLRERYIDRSFRQFDDSVIGNVENFFSWTMELGDKAIADGAWLTFYKQGLKEGLDDSAAILKADDLTRKSVAGRGIGEMPLSQKAKVTKLFTPFQVEVRNAVNVLKDLGSSKDIAGIMGVFITSFLMNEILKTTTGREIGFNPIGTVTDSVQDGSNVAYGLLGNALTNYPGGSYIAAGLKGTVGANSYQMQELFGQNDPSRFGTGNIAMQTLLTPLWDGANGQNVDLLKPLTATLPKFGGKQLERSIRGLQDMAILPKEKVNLQEGVSLEKQSSPASYSQSGRLRFALEPNAKNYLTAPTLGTWSTKEGKAYIENGNKALGEKQTEVFKKLNGTPEIEKFIREFPNKVGLQRQAILNSKLTPEQKKTAGQLVNSDKAVDYSSKVNFDFSMLSDEKKQKYLGLDKIGIDKKEFMEIMEYVDINDNGSTTQAEAKRILDNRDLTNKQKSALWKVINKGWKYNPYE